MIFYKNKNVKPLHLLIGFIISSVIIIFGVFIKINGSKNGKTLIIIGLIIKTQIILMIINKYGREIIKKIFNRRK